MTQKETIHSLDSKTLAIRSWGFLLLSILGFISLSVIQEVGLLAGVITSAIICFFSHFSWQARVSSILVKRFFTKTMFGFLLDIIRKRSLKKAFQDFIKIDENTEKEIEEIIKKQSKWLVITPTLMFLGTLCIDLILTVSFQYFLIAELYFALIGFIWMRLCKNNKLTMLPLEFEL